MKIEVELEYDYPNGNERIEGPTLNSIKYDIKRRLSKGANVEGYRMKTGYKVNNIKLKEEHE